MDERVACSAACIWQYRRARRAGAAKPRWEMTGSILDSAHLGLRACNFGFGGFVFMPLLAHLHQACYRRRGWLLYPRVQHCFSPHTYSTCQRSCLSQWYFYISKSRLPSRSVSGAVHSHSKLMQAVISIILAFGRLANVYDDDAMMHLPPPHEAHTTNNIIHLKAHLRPLRSSASAPSHPQQAQHPSAPRPCTHPPTQ